MKKLLITVLLPIMTFIGGCASQIGANQYNTSSVGSVNNAVIGTVVSVRSITVADNNTSSGTAVGAIAGGIAGSQIGKGNTAGLIGAVGGTLIGGAAGSMAQRGMSKQSGYEYVIKLDNGSLITLTQGNDVLIANGQRCMVLYGNGSARARVVPYNGY